MGNFPKCNSSGVALESGLLGSGPCQAHPLPGKCLGRPQCSSQGDTLRSSCLRQIRPSALHLSGCTALNKVLGKDQHSPFSGLERHLLTLPIPVQWHKVVVGLVLSRRGGDLDLLPVLES